MTYHNYCIIYIKLYEYLTELPLWVLVFSQGNRVFPSTF